MTQKELPSPPWKSLENTYHMEGNKYLSLSQILLLSSSLWTFQQWFPPHNPSIISLRGHELLSLMAHSPFSQAEELIEVSTFLAPPLILYSWNSPPMCDRDPLSQLSVFHFHLLEIIPPLARIEAVILNTSQNNFSTFSKASRHMGLNLHEVGLQLSRY